MLVNLKQNEIIAALKQYVANQGISLVGKDVEIAFTAGRKESGISADISIEDSGLPVFTGSGEETKQPVEATVLSIVKPEVAAAEPEAIPEPAAEPEPVAVKTTSLFS